MRLQNFIIKESSSLGDQEINAIKRDCKKYLSKIHFGQKLFRGVGNRPPGGFAMKTVRTDRKPMDTPKDVHDILDDLFQKKFGIRARSDTAFCTTILWQAEEYGYPCYFFPIGDFRILFHKDIMDLTADLQERSILNVDYSTGRRTYHMNTDNLSIKKQLDDLINGYEITSDPNKMFSSPGEVMVKCDKYYLVDVDVMDKDDNFEKIFRDTTKP